MEVDLAVVGDQSVPREPDDQMPNAVPLMVPNERNHFVVFIDNCH